jgi:hypothetical protein
MIRASILKLLSLLFYRVSFSRMSQGGGGHLEHLPAGVREFSGNVLEKHGMREFSKNICEKRQFQEV